MNERRMKNYVDFTCFETPVQQIRFYFEKCYDKNVCYDGPEGSCYSTNFFATLIKFLLHKKAFLLHS